MYSELGELEIKKISKILEESKEKLDGIVLMLDSHYIMDISHSSYWIDFENNHPLPFTEIKRKEAKGRKYNVYMPSAPREIFEEKQKMVVEYLESLEIINKKHIIKPDHCLIGTWGHNVYQSIIDQVGIWSKAKGRDCQLVLKGLYQHSEHFGAFEAGIPNPNVPETMLNQGILQYLDNFENVYIWGAKDVLFETMKQLSDCAEQVDGGHDIYERYVVVTDDEDIKKYCEEKKYRNISVDNFKID
jgi:nicotinamidase-related amidase